MCRGSAVCTELGSNPVSWARHSPLPPPSRFVRAHEVILSVLELIERGETDAAIVALQIPLADEVKSWYIEHGQMSGEHRFKGLGGIAEPTYGGARDPVKSVGRFEEQVYLRDNYFCQYCSFPVFHPKVLKGIESALGRENFSVSANSNEERHGFIYTIRATADHVVPHNKGGRTELENLVTSCWSCNYGKSGYALAEINLDDPR